MKKIIQITQSLVLAATITLVLLLTVRGNSENPNSKDLNTKAWKENGPFELSPERGRFALLYSIVEDKSLFFSTDLARFTTPDLGYKNGHYVSLFAPAVSYITSIGYLIGKQFGLSQVGAFLTISLFALFNGLLIHSISKKLGASNTASTIATLVYLFATPAFAYSVSLYQHQISTFLILMSLRLLLSTPNCLKLFFIWFLCAASIPVDYPNLFLMAPIGISALSWLFSSEQLKDTISINLKVVYLFSFLGLALPLLFFFWFNFHSYGNPLQFSGTVESVAEIDQFGNPTVSRLDKTKQIEDLENPAPKSEKSAIGFFETRDILNGFYIHFLSPDRGILHFSPIILLGLLGIVIAYQRKLALGKVLISIIGVNLILYSMWGDPWGGWAFGSRYLIPTYSILSIFIAVLLTKFNKNIILILVFWLLSLYSVMVNTAGALSTSAMPPKVQVLELERISGMVQKYTYERNLDFLKNGQSKSFFYNTFFKNRLSAFHYYQFIAGTISLIISIEILYLYLNNKNEN